MKLNRKWLMIVALVMSMAVATGGTLAYLTDRDSEVNVFTIGNVEIDLTEGFGQGAQLIPNVKIEKTPVITNTGNNDAWVWMEFAIPTVLDNFVQGTEQGSDENIIHWNPLGATAEGYVTDDRVNNAIAAGYLPEGITAAEILADNMTWDVFNSLGEGKNAYQKEINGVQYNVYVLLYNKALTPGETTLTSIYQVYLDARVDVDPNGDMYLVENGVVTGPVWNVKDDGNPMIYVSAYAIQADENITSVEDAYKLYGEQWGTNGSEYATPSLSTAANAEQLVAALAAGGNVALTNDIDLGTTQLTVSADTVLNLNGHDITAETGELTTTYGMFNILPGKTLTVQGSGDVKIVTHVTKGISAAIFQNDGNLIINGGNYEANQEASVAGLGAVIAVIDNCPYNNAATVTINDGTFAVTGQGAINVIRNWPIAKGASATLIINGGTFKANTLKTTTYIWSKNDTQNAGENAAVSKVTINGGTFDAGYVLEVDGYKANHSIATGVTNVEMVEGSMCGYLD